MTLLKLNQPVNHSFNGLFDSLFNELPGTIAKSNAQNDVPRVNIHETKDAFVLELNAPGRKKENFHVSLDKNLLTISYENAEHTSNEEIKAVRREFTLGNFKRTFTVDEKIAADNIQARYEQGILVINLPKKEEVKVSPKSISIQ